jgi:protein gp37
MILIMPKKLKMAKSTIEWTESTWNPITGCTKISAGCKNCYASILSKRLQAMGQKKYQNGFAPTMHPDTLGDPFKWKNGKLVFVNSMSDSFHKEFPLTFIQQMFSVMNETPRHTYQVLTKRADRLEELSTFLNWTDNIWMGVSVENEKTINRIDHLRKTGAKVKFLSCEPLIGPLPNINLEGIDWVIVGGESGPNARPMEKEWVDDIQQQCEKAGVAFFFKQWGGVNKKKTGRLLNGRTYDEMPSIA